MSARGQDPSFCLAQGHVEFYLPYTWAPKIKWTTNAGTILKGQGTDAVTIQFSNHTGRFYVQAMESDGNGDCKDSTRIFFDIEDCEPEFWIPNAFTPNYDGKNDYFHPITHNFIPVKYTMIIFNRWGEQVFVSNNLDHVWNGVDEQSGEQAPEGVYVYKIKAEDLYGNKVSETGRITLLR